MILYVAGPFRAETWEGIQENIENAKKVAKELWERHHAPICPHANTDWPPESCGATQDDYLQGDILILARCDGIVMVPGYQDSEGAMKELQFAQNRDMPVWYYPDLPEPHPVEVNSPFQCMAFIDTVMKMYRLHLDKNMDYSPANILGTGELGAVTRLWDKISRLMSLYGYRIKIESSHYEVPREPKNESIDDSWVDAANYAVIGQILRKGAWGI